MDFNFGITKEESQFGVKSFMHFKKNFKIKEKDAG